MIAMLLALALAVNDPTEGYDWQNCPMGEPGYECFEPVDLWNAALAYRFKLQDCEDDLADERVERHALEAKLETRTSTVIDLIATHAADRAIEKRENEGWSKATWFWTGTTAGLLVAAAIAGTIAAFAK
jgi:hypothetical protein